METADVTIERSTPDDLPAVEALLIASDLVLDDAAKAFETGVVARAEDGALLACAAIEPFGDAAFLRSVAVAEGRRGEGLGRAIVQAAEQVARETGAREIYLLTETAADWFPRLGYERVERDLVPPAVRTSVEFVSACPVSALVMRRALDA